MNQNARNQVQNVIYNLAVSSYNRYRNTEMFRASAQ